MANPWKLFAAVCSLLSVVNTRAPGDADRLCTVTLPTTGELQPAPLPANAKVLMDSFDYILLLPRAAGGVWQQVDLDDNNLAGRGTRWNQNTNIPCRQTVNVCGFEEGPQNNWLITQYISRRVGDVLLPQVSVQVVFELRGCVAACQRTFVVNIYETSTENSTIARETDNYQLVSRVASDDDTGLTSQNQTRETDFSTAAEGFYIAIRDETTCIVLQRLIVFYNVCPGGPGNLVMRPETIAPPVDRMSQPLEVTAQCVEGASPDGEGEVRLTCNQGGVWNAIPGSGCSCDPGFNTSADRRSCIALCGAGEYYSVTFAECRDCPANTVPGDSGLAVCPCAEEYYRADGEEDLPCTQPPSMPRNVQVIDQTSNSVTLSWEEPEDLGGRDDLSYVLCAELDGMMDCTTVMETTGTITGLNPGAQYTITVTATNGVTPLIPIENATSITSPIQVSISSSDSSTPVIVGGIIAVIVAVMIVLIIIILVFLLYRARSSTRTREKYNITNTAIPIPVNRHRTYVDPTTYASPDEAVEEFAKEIEPKTLRLDSEIGAGEFGTVFRGIWKESPKKQVAVAVKTLKPGSTGRMRTDFLNEASIMGQFNHDNVIKLYGVVTRVDPAMIVMEFMDNGSLHSYLRKNDEKLSSLHLLKMIHGVCSGMEYLSTVGYVHRDLAARNVLVSREEICKVADFGLSREVIDDEYNVQKGGKIPVRWTAPEAIYRRKFTSSSDVWSFGVLMWEVMTFSQQPYDEWDNQTVLDQLEAGYRLEIPHNCPPAVYTIMLDCWNKELSSRPSFSDLLKRLNGLLNIESPPKRAPKRLRNSANSGATNPLQCKSVEDWLTSVKMERYIPQFQENGINSVNQLVHLTEPDLREMGITLAGHLHKLTQSIESGYIELKRASHIPDQH